MSNINKIKGYRNMIGKTQSEMAKELDISSQSYYNKENGYVSFKDKEKIKIKNMLIPLFPKITIEDIFFD
ncbi:helix-turn-helix transcriptional regulator [Lactococcus lactis]|uniref:helix-turn-helix transcriptional regulator n=1 Tax=Lactococcus lactis TaxID=1358 RepID=UPI00189A1759|nr:helix-turn-helix transcriptional regulator [Lactococcus lactis]